MAEVDFEALVKDMGKAALPHLKGGATKAKKFGKAEADKLARTAVMLAKGVAKGEIDKGEAQLILDVQKNAARSVLLTIEGLGILAVERSINAAMDVLKATIQKVIKVAL